jgi:aspartate aminotransferase
MNRATSLQPVASYPTGLLAAERRAAGGDVVSLYGSPWWLPPEHVLEAARSAVVANTALPAPGLPSLRAAAAERLRVDSGVDVDPEHGVIVTNAANHALLVAFLTLLDPGDEVLAYAPHYYYAGLVALAGGVWRTVPTRQEDGWAWDADALRSAVTPRTKVLVVNTPTNPTGWVASREDLAALADIAAEHDLTIISDEAYDHTVYSGAEHVSIASLPAAHDRTLTVLSCTKSYVLRHWRVGFIAGPPALVALCRKVLEWSVFSVNHVAQYAAEAAMSGPQDFVSAIGDRFGACRERMLAGLAEVPGVTFAAPRGGPFLFFDASAIPGGAERLWRELLLGHGVATDLGESFGAPDHLRLMFGGEDADIDEAASRLVAAATALEHADA